MDNFSDFNFQKDEEKAFEEFFKEYSAAFIYFSCKFVRNMTIAEDIVVDSFVKLWEKRNQLSTEKELKNYMYKIVYNASLRWLERQRTKTKVYQIYNSEHPESDQSYFENVVRAETLRIVKEAMDKLPNECKKVFLKLFIEGKSIKETAGELDVAVSTVKNQKARGIKLLRAKLT